MGSTSGSCSVARPERWRGFEPEVADSALTGNGLDGPGQAAFDGERMGLTDTNTSRGQMVSFWKATDWLSLGSVEVSANFDCGLGVCSDGVNFRITLRLTSKPARF